MLSEVACRAKAIFATVDVYYDVPTRSAAMNMAIDEALLEIVAAPSIRFYRWDHPSLSFGYFGRIADVANYDDRDCVRRWTGGGIVLHGEDLTYSLVIPATDPVFRESSISIYEKLHCAIRDVFADAGQRATVAGSADAGAGVSDPGYNRMCFANPVRADVMLNGRKVAGAAQRRTRRGLLQQGSIQLADGRVRPTGGQVDLAPDFAERFVRQLSPRCEPRSLENELLCRAREIAGQKYGTDSWLRRR